MCFMVADLITIGLRHRRRLDDHEIRRLEHYMQGTFTVHSLDLASHPYLRRQRRAPPDNVQADTKRRFWCRFAVSRALLPEDIRHHISIR